MKVLVTGGAGYLGSVLVRKLLASGNKVVVLDNFLYTGSSLLDVITNPNLTVVNGDVRDEVPVSIAMRHCDAVVHLAALVGDPMCRKYKDIAHEVNVDGSKTILRGAEHLGIKKFIFASTCSNYGKMDREESEYVNEDSLLNPVSDYAHHKVDIENELSNYRDLNPTILRFATLYGVSSRMRFDLTVNQFAMEAIVARHLDVYGERFYRPYLHVADAATCIIKTLFAPSMVTANKIWNVGSTLENYTKENIVNLIKEEVTLHRVDYVHKDEDPRDYKVSFAKIKNELGFLPIHTVRDGIREVVLLVRSGIIHDCMSDAWRNV